MWGHGKEWERRGVWETGSVTYVFMEKVLSFFLVIVTACSNGVFISVLSPSWKGHTCHNSPSLSVNSHLDAGGLVPVRHLGEGRLGLKSPVVSLGDAVGDTVLGVQISLDIGRRNGCTQNWRHQSWSDLVTRPTLTHSNKSSVHAALAFHTVDPVKFPHYYCCESGVCLASSSCSRLEKLGV